MKDTVINQAYLYLNDIDISEDEHGDILLFQYSEIEGEDDAICISKEKSREVALAIFPDLEREKEEFAIGLMMWANENGWEICTVGAMAIPTFESQLTDQVIEYSELIELYKNRDNENT